MLKLGRKSKKMSGGINNELPPEQDDIVEQGSSEDCVTPMPAAYSVPSANLNYPGDEIDAMRQVASVRRPSSKKTLPPLFIYIEAGDYQRAIERAKRHPREARAWASIKIKSSSGETTKRLALHQACFKLRTAGASTVTTTEEDPFIQVCRFILFLIELNPDACRERETRHGCLPLHLAAFASCTRSSGSNKATADENDNDSSEPALLSPSNSTFSTASMSSALPSSSSFDTSSKSLSRPAALSHNQRSLSEATADTYQTTMTAAIAEERFTGSQPLAARVVQPLNASPSKAAREQPTQTQSVSMGNNIFVSEKREEWIVKVLNALLDAYPRAIRSGSEGGRMPLHFACAGRATPRVISTLITAYPDAAKHRTKDGSLPIHLCAHWGISHSNVVVIMLKSYPDSTYGRNRWERTPLEEALCMAGENGRPHQAALVRALRKHHSFWTRPEGVLLHEAHSSTRKGTRRLVDTDATLDGMEDSMNGDDDDGPFLLNTFGAMCGSFDQVEEPLSPSTTDLPTLIRASKWDLAVQRLQLFPGEARLNLRVPTRGGFTSTQGFSPLHYACERRPPKEFVSLLASLYPEAVVRKAMPGGKLPLHIACTWHAPKETISALLAVDRRTSRIPDDLGNLPIHAACFAGASAPVIEKLLKAYPKAVLSRTNQGSLPEEITKRLKHDNRLSALALLSLCKEEVDTKRKMKHRRHLSEGYGPTSRESGLSGFDPSSYDVDNYQSNEVEISYSNENEAKKELMWI